MQLLFKKALVVLCLASSCAIASEQSFRVFFDKEEFYLPSAPKLALLVGNEDDSTIFKYSDETGKKFIGISFMSTHPDLDMGCPLEVLLSDVFVGTKKSNCDQKSTYAFKGEFVEGSDNGYWENGDQRFYYSVGKDKSHVFIVRKDKRIIQIDTDFLDKPAIRTMLSKHL